MNTPPQYRWTLEYEQVKNCWVAKESLVLKNDLTHSSVIQQFTAQEKLSYLMMNTPHATVWALRYLSQVQQLFGYSVNFFLKI